jgi:lipopolysaccharide/colanic/teichoic acid biosynthesis glycosyltransferase
MRVIITGASGFIGTRIIPFLKKQKVELLLVGRDTDKLKALFPQDQVTSYANLKKRARGYHALVHLAVMNNDKSDSIHQFRDANVILLSEVLDAVRSAGVKLFINTTTLHSARRRHVSNYAQTKWEGEKRLSEIDDIAVINIRLPAVYGSTFAGKLATLSKLPAFLSPIAFKVLASFKPTVNVDLVAEEILKSLGKVTSLETIVSDRQHNNQVYHAIKRILDLTFVFLVVLVFWWVLLTAWLAVKFTSPGPGIFAQTRIGKNGVNFTCYKFRTMLQGTEITGTHELTTDSVTTVGYFLRKTKIDELPQIWNILKGEMSLVGPRPCLPNQRKLIKKRTELGVLDVCGGITGWAQIQGVDMADPCRLAKLDSEYLVLRTVFLDLRIILATAIGRGQGDRVR